MILAEEGEGAENTVSIVGIVEKTAAVKTLTMTAAKTLMTAVKTLTPAAVTQASAVLEASVASVEAVAG